jgi:hypothetical protein
MNFLEKLTSFLFLMALAAVYSVFGGPLTLGKAWVLNFLASSLFKGSSSSKESK